MKRVSKKYMKQVGYGGTAMYFYVDNAPDLAGKVGGNVSILGEEKYFGHTNKAGMKFGTSVSMCVPDLFKMVKMVHLDP